MELSASLGGTIDQLQGRVMRLLKAEPRDRRILIALSGVPGSGKSTIAAALLVQLEHMNIRDVVVAPMDGYHYTKATLANFKDPVEAFRRRGAPFTFDVQSFIETVCSLRSTSVISYDDPARDFWMPSFDHTVQDPVPNGIRVPETTRVVIVEGNYVLFDQAPWNKLADMVDERWFVDTSRHIAKHRIAKRHLNAGIEHTQRAAEERAEENDLPNGDLIRAKLVMPDVVIVND